MFSATNHFQSAHVAGYVAESAPAHSEALYSLTCQKKHATNSFTANLISAKQ
jgi:hypothetical protein